MVQSVKKRKVIHGDMWVRGSWTRCSKCKGHAVGVGLVQGARRSLGCRGVNQGNSSVGLGGGYKAI